MMDPDTRVARGNNQLAGFSTSYSLFWPFVISIHLMILKILSKMGLQTRVSGCAHFRHALQIVYCIGQLIDFIFIPL